MSMYSSFKRNDRMEQEGIQIPYGGFKVTIARAGGANKKFIKIMEQKSHPHRRAIATETLDENLATELLYEAYAEGIVLDWFTETKDEDGEGTGEYVQGIEGPDGEIMKFNQENVIATFHALPELFLEIKGQAETAGLFKASNLAEDAKNS